VNTLGDASGKHRQAPDGEDEPERLELTDSLVEAETEGDAETEVDALTDSLVDDDTDGEADALLLPDSDALGLEEAKAGGPVMPSKMA